MKRDKRQKKDNIIEKRMIISCVFLVGTVVLTVLSNECDGMAEWYSVHVYAVIASVIGRISGLFPFSLAELCLYVFLILLAGTLIHTLGEAFLRKKGKMAVLRWGSGVFLAASVLILLYVTNCGINYHRLSFSEKAGLVLKEYTVEELKQVCIWLTEEVNRRAGTVRRDISGVMQLAKPEAEGAVSAMEQLGKTYSCLAGYYPTPKGLLVSEILSYQSLTGIYSPFTVEANYNKDMAPYNIPFTACHELSHLRGFMQEEEANFIAFLACKDSPREDFQYSGYLMGWIYCMNTLRQSDYQEWEDVRQGLNTLVETDLKENNQFWASYEGAVAEVSTKVNDTYLKANGQNNGVQSYDKMVDLIVAYYGEM